MLFLHCVFPFTCSPSTLLKWLSGGPRRCYSLSSISESPSTTRMAKDLNALLSGHSSYVMSNSPSDARTLTVSYQAIVLPYVVFLIYLLVGCIVRLQHDDLGAILTDNSSVHYNPRKSRGTIGLYTVIITTMHCAFNDFHPCVTIWLTATQ